MKKIPWFITLLSILLNIGLVYLFFIKGKTIEIEDTRVAVVLTEYQKDFALNERFSRKYSGDKPRNTR